MPDAPTPNSMPGATPEAPPAAPAPDAPPATPPPPWGDNPEDFDPAKAWGLITNLRASEDSSKGMIASQRSEIETLKAQLAAAPPQTADDLATALGNIQTLTERLSAVEQTAKNDRDTALQAKAEALASNRDENRAGSAYVNPKTAAKLIDLSECLTEAGEIDEAAIASKLDALAETDPYLVAQATTPGRKPNPAQGHGGGAVPLDAQIKAAEERGDVMASIALKQQKHYTK
ncbi:hypothetical protein ONA92_24160 [Mycobacteroides salmoniphilum]|uniref:hypothetical protein n=1 Tax=Mycobacteroides salmoniphilum TaxID=404941 RepID=UPI003568A346